MDESAGQNWSIFTISLGAQQGSAVISKAEVNKQKLPLGIQRGDTMEKNQVLKQDQASIIAI